MQPDELGVVLRFGKYVRDAKPGLNYHLPYPIESVLMPKVTRVNRIDIGMRMVEDLRRGTTVRDVPEESLMLTGDENIVDVDFTVFWLVKPDGAADYLFNIQMAEGTVKAVAESAMREVVGRTDSEKITTVARQSIETDVQELMQKVLDSYQAGMQVTQVQLQKVDPPTQVIDSLRDVQAARIDLERAQNEAQTYANRVVPEARGRASQILQSAEAYASRPSPKPAVRPRASSASMKSTRRRRTSPASASISRPWSGCSGPIRPIILDFGGAAAAAWCPSCRSISLSRPQPATQGRPAATQGGRRPMRLNVVGGIVAAIVIVALIIAYGVDLHGLSDAPGDRRPAR